MDVAEADVLVAQYLKERGHSVAFLAMLDSSDVTEHKVSALAGGRLREILDAHTEAQLAPAGADAQHKELQDPLLETPADGHFARDLWCDMHDVHAGNALCVRLVPGGVLSGAADKTVRLTAVPDDLDDAASAVASSRVVHTCAAPALCVDVCPADADRLLVGDMAGNAAVVSVTTGDVLFAPERHAKYVVRVAWSACGNYFATASWDHEARLYAASGAAGADGDAGAAPPYRVAKQLRCSGQVTAAAFTPASVPASEAELALTVRDDNRIHLVTLGSLEHRHVNMNANGDDWVSFTAMDVSFSPSGQFLLVSTDKDRLILMSRATGAHLRNFYGASNDEYSTPRHCWHPSGQYIYATSQTHDVLVWEVYSGKVVASMTDHDKPIKDLCYDKARGALASTGFDKSVKLWKEIL